MRQARTDSGRPEPCWRRGAPLPSPLSSADNETVCNTQLPRSLGNKRCIRVRNKDYLLKQVQTPAERLTVLLKARLASLSSQLSAAPDAYPVSLAPEEEEEEEEESPERMILLLLLPEGTILQELSSACCTPELSSLPPSLPEHPTKGFPEAGLSIKGASLGPGGRSGAEAPLGKPEEASLREPPDPPKNPLGNPAAAAWSHRDLPHDQEGRGQEVGWLPGQKEGIRSQLGSVRLSGCCRGRASAEQGEEQEGRKSQYGRPSHKLTLTTTTVNIDLLFSHLNSQSGFHRKIKGWIEASLSPKGSHSKKKKVGGTSNHHWTDAVLGLLFKGTWSRRGAFSLTWTH
ncbi:uncharacterized protein LOC128337599 isoform X1 [Hemicordylus capensis]|uniref:uncharacterized protein LOC128337592 isoform X2 n=1 Tax=Hemicordylus capensis TaxID=884348 RepID=UPI0023027CC9|nr:uncharacterized protein LOC128337592 isoform X2 [Hemicordylus capensis]XP_053134762.1 uncharacterized protein LOC128337592 isoform X2 [Hemicordylus capensis]XP_053134763.1 uncharacterized protein LOC128337592 isoform X2 [Hemicordylus capensis]XP_053134777.1 uncharacterized protein LOC128337599 isoform X1 [Hemicordylus capensis]XP_053134778.1 uncharacterized protein LOC128337599 isoform X1 [Hemicordylus capensis]